MAIDWSIVAPIATSLIGAAIGAALNHVFERRPRLISYIGHVASHQIPQASGHPLHFFTHSVVLKNTGHKPANNVRLKHQFLPTYAVHPPLVAHTPEKYPVGQGGDIVFPKLVPQTEITISYLYFPPVRWIDINEQVESDEGPAKILNVLPGIQHPVWVRRIAVGLALNS